MVMPQGDFLKVLFSKMVQNVIFFPEISGNFANLKSGASE